MIGNRFSKWLVLERVADKSKLQRFLCRCDCGNERVVYKQGLKRGLSTQCQPCANKISNKKKQSSKEQFMPEEMVGKSFGAWRVIRIAKNKAANGSYQFHCECECGKRSILQGPAIRKGHTRQCTKCANKNNIPPCRFCRCKNHKNIDLEESLCDFLGCCPVCDKWPGIKIYLETLA